MALHLESLKSRELLSYKVIDLGTLGGPGSMAYGINDSGQIAGYAATPFGTLHAVRWDQGQAIDLGTPDSGLSEAFGINNAGGRESKWACALRRHGASAGTTRPRRWAWIALRCAPIHTTPSEGVNHPGVVA